jgi:dipeptidase
MRAVLAAAALGATLSEACTNFIVTPGASTDGSTVFSYSFDEDGVYGTLGHLAAGKHPSGTQRQIYDIDSGKLLGSIEEAAETYNVMHNLNEHGVAIGETTFGGLEQLQGTGIIDYGSIIQITLQRVKTAREAVSMFATLLDTYGYASSGESFTIGDPKEVWIMEVIGKGKWSKGAVWVAVRVPDGHVSSHANQARIQQFPRDDPDNCVYAKDVVDFAVQAGLWEQGRSSSEFSFSDTYDPITFSGARQSDARAWTFLSAVAEDREFGKKYLDYVLGKPGMVTPAHRMPLSVPVWKKTSPMDLMMHHRNHYEGTELDPTKDVGAGPSGSAYRARPIVWEHKNNSYINERTVGTQQTSWSFVAHLRKDLPAPIGGVLWFGVDDATFSVHMPFHGGNTRVPHVFADGNGDALTWSQSGFWAFNTVANFVYPRWNLAPRLIEQAHAKELAFEHELVAEEAKALQLYASDPAAAVEFLTATAEARADKVVKDEWALFGQLMVQNRDGLVVSSLGPNAPTHGGLWGGVVPDTKEPGYSDAWKARIVADDGDHLLMTDSKTHPDLSLQAAKLRVLGHHRAAQQAATKATAAPIMV